MLHEMENAITLYAAKSRSGSYRKPKRTDAVINVGCLGLFFFFLPKEIGTEDC
jgi:hypothetical protein